MNQSILTTHSPFVLEQFSPENVVLLERDTNGSLGASQIEVSGIKGKTYRGNLRRILAESMLGNGVICVEGVSDAEVLYAASNVLESYDEELSYTPLDLSGVTVVQCEGDGGILRYGQFFKGLGLKTYVFYDLQKNAAIKNDIEALFDRAWELDHTGIEYLLAEETDIDVVRGFLEEAGDWDDYPSNSKRPELYAYDEDLDDDDARAVTKRVLKARKGSGYAEKLVEMSSDEDLPEIISTALNAISEDLPNVMVGDDAEGDDEATEDLDDDA
jgi:putative ATP-dependent endonuclease of OLD family